MSDPDLVRVATRLARVLGEDRCLLIGGLAVGAHGYARATDGIDFVVSGSLADVRRRLEEKGIPTKMTRGDVLEGGFSCLKGTLEGIPFDILPPLVLLEWENAREVPTETGRLRVVDLEGLLRLKLHAQGIQDVLDAAVLVLRHPEQRDKAREIAAAYRVRDRLDSFLADARTQATAAEEKAREERAMNPPKRPRRGARAPSSGRRTRRR